MDSRGEETTSQSEKVVPQKERTFVEKLKEITDTRVAELDKLIEEIEPKGNPEWLNKEIPFHEGDFHVFMSEILKLRKHVLQLQYTMYALAQATLDHSLDHLSKSEENTQAIARLSAGDAVLEMVQKASETPYRLPNTKHDDRRYG